jgi:hypothetical protein
MELVIDGITKLIYHTYHGRKIGDIRVDKRHIRVDKRHAARDTSYVFTFPPIGKGLTGWDKELEVYLCKYPTPNEEYELFVMGLHGVTCIYLKIDEIKDIKVFQTYMVLVIDKAKRYWETL